MFNSLYMHDFRFDELLNLKYNYNNILGQINDCLF